MRYWRQTAPIREAIFSFLQSPQVGPQPAAAHVCSSPAEGPPSQAGMSRQLTKSGANSRHPNKHAQSGVVRHCSNALQQLSRRQERQLASLGPWHTRGCGPLVSSSDPLELEPVASVVSPCVELVWTSPVVPAAVVSLASAAPEELDDVPEVVSSPVVEASCPESPPSDAVTEQPPTSITRLRARRIRPGPSP